MPKITATLQSSVFFLAMISFIMITSLFTFQILSYKYSKTGVFS